jgi:soluble lytic murein transglycosylase-like protein
MDPRVLSQLLRFQMGTTSANAGYSSGMSGMSGTETGSGEGNLFSQLLGTLLGSSDTQSLFGSQATTIPAEYASYGALGTLTGNNNSTYSQNSLSGLSPGTYAALSALKTYSLPASLTQPATYDPLITEAGTKHGVDLALIKAVIDQESSFNPLAQSSAGAKGLMQLMDGTAAGLGVTDSFDAEQNINGGVKYLADLLNKYNGDEAIALAAYNGGPGRVDGLGIKTRADLLAMYTRLPQETQAYVEKVLGKKALYQPAAGASAI